MSSLPPNAYRLLEFLIRTGSAYRADLARALDVSRTTITNLTAHLLEMGWLEEVGGDAGGELKRLLGLSPRAGVLASVVYEAQQLEVLVATLDGRCLRAGERVFARECTAAQRLEAGAELLRELLAAEGEKAELSALYLAVDTQMDKESGRVYETPASRNWEKVNPKAYFVNLFNTMVVVQNTARLRGLAEYFGQAPNCPPDLLYVQVAHGVTSGRVVAGQLHEGWHGGSGELGHCVYNWGGPLCTCGNYGCLMQYVSRPALEAQASLLCHRAVSLEELAADHAAGLPYAHTLAQRAATVLARMLCNVCHLDNPGTIVLGGEVISAFPQLPELVADYLRRHALPLIGLNTTVEAAASPPADVSPLRAVVEAGILDLRRRPEVGARALEREL